MSTPAQAIEALSQAFKADPDFAYTWHCSIAMACYDSMEGYSMLGPADHRKIGNEAASRFMKLAFDVETKGPESY